MEKSEIKAKVIDMLNNLFPDSGVDTDILEFVDLIDDFGMDSITFISVVIEIEANFGITVPDEMLLMENFKNVNNILYLIESRLENKN